MEFEVSGNPIHTPLLGKYAGGSSCQEHLKKSLQCTPASVYLCMLTHRWLNIADRWASDLVEGRSHQRWHHQRPMVEDLPQGLCTVPKCGFITHHSYHTLRWLQHRQKFTSKVQPLGRYSGSCTRTREQTERRVRRHIVHWRKTTFSRAELNVKAKR